MFDRFTFADANREKQCNPTHTPTGPGHKAGYYGAKNKSDLDNRLTQQNPMYQWAKWGNELLKELRNSFFWYNQCYSKEMSLLMFLTDFHLFSILK